MKTIRYLALGLLSLFLVTLWASPATIKTVSIQQETPTAIINIKYPQGFSHPSINKAVLKLINDARESFGKPDPTQADLPKDLPGKNSLNIDYKIMYQEKKAVSIFFSFSLYSRGAAHPANTVKIVNFLDGKPVLMGDLFKANTPYLTTIASYCHTILQKKQLSDEKWLNDGTQAVAKNYQNWYFTPFGVAVVFDTYQVAPYVSGPQTVQVPRTQFNTWLRPPVVAKVWSGA